MHLVALVGAGDQLAHTFRLFRDTQDRFHLHPVQANSMAELIRALKKLDFAGALIISEAAQREALRVAERSSLDAGELEAADTLTVTPAGVVADHTLGRAVAAMLREKRWDAKGAHAVIVGANLESRATARELTRLGVSSLTLLDDDRVSAEKALPRAAGVMTEARDSRDPLATTMLERADILIRATDTIKVPDTLLGPHLAIVDLLEAPHQNLLKRGIELGALTFTRNELMAHRFELSLGQVLGGPVGIEPFKTLFGA